MVVAKSERAYTALKAAFKERTVEKGYHALVQGHPDPLARHDRRARSTGTRSTTGGSPSSAAGGRRSRTTRCWRRSRPPAWSTCSWRPGRTHQIRVHFSALRHPCVGDTTYGADPTLAARLGRRAAVAARRPARVRRIRPTGAGWSSPASTRPTSPARWPSCAPRADRAGGEPDLPRLARSPFGPAALAAVVVAGLPRRRRARGGPCPAPAVRGPAARRSGGPPVLLPAAARARVGPGGARAGHLAGLAASTRARSVCAGPSSGRGRSPGCWSSWCWGSCSARPGRSGPGRCWRRRTRPAGPARAGTPSGRDTRRSRCCRGRRGSGGCSPSSG